MTGLMLIMKFIVMMINEISDDDVNKIWHADWLRALFNKRIDTKMAPLCHTTLVQSQRKVCKNLKKTCSLRIYKCFFFSKKL